VKIKKAPEWGLFHGTQSSLLLVALAALDRSGILGFVAIYAQLVGGYLAEGQLCRGAFAVA